MALTRSQRRNKVSSKDHQTTGTIDANPVIVVSNQKEEKKKSKIKVAKKRKESAKVRTGGGHAVKSEYTTTDAALMVSTHDMQEKQPSYL